MLIAVVSDTHNLSDYAKRAMDICRERGVQRILHCGDICNVEIVDIFREIPTEYVFGNCDSARNSLTLKMQSAGAILHGRFGSVLWDERKIAFLHGDDEAKLMQTYQSNEWDMVCYGHTHRQMLSRYGRTLVLNPGAFQRRYERASFCIVRLPEFEVISIPVE